MTQNPVIYTPRYSGSILENIVLTGISIDDARRIAQELISTYVENENISCDDDASQHHELMTEILEVLMDENRKYYFLCDEESFEIDNQPFQNTCKMGQSNLHKLMADYHETYYCTICLETVQEPNRGVKLICGERCIFCRDCISNWLMKSIAKCPYCSYDYSVLE